MKWWILGLFGKHPKTYKYRNFYKTSHIVLIFSFLLFFHFSLETYKTIEKGIYIYMYVYICFMFFFSPGMVIYHFP